MGNEIKAAFKEVVDRVIAANAVMLEGVKIIKGPVEESLGEKDMPAIIYELLNGGGFSEDTHFPDRARTKFTVLFTVMTHTRHGYYSDDGLGIIDLYEKLMDVIDGTGEGDTRDLTGNNNWGPTPPQFRIGGLERSGLMFTYLIEVQIQTNRYARGSLRS